MEGFGVNTYKMVNAEGDTVLVKYHFHPRCGLASLTQAEAEKVQGDDTKIWPEDQFPLRHIGVMTLNRNVEDHHNENEQISMGTGVLVDGLDFSDDKMLVGRTFSYSDTQRYRVGPNYLQLPVNQPNVVEGRVHTNQHGGQMSYGGSRFRTESARQLRTLDPQRAARSRTQAEQPPEITGRLTQSVLEPRKGQILTAEDQKRLKNLGNNGDKIDPNAWSKWTSSVHNHQAKAEEVLNGMKGVKIEAPPKPEVRETTTA
jgi:catalase